MLTYSFENIGSDALYEYLYKCIKTDILQGSLTAGEKLPSKRSFAKNLGVSVITVENAYAQLVAEGYLYSLPKKGFFVTDIKRMDPHMPHANRDKSEESALSLDATKSTYLADFTSNQTSSETFPFSVWAKLIRELLNDNRLDLMTNPPCGGIYPLREAIAENLREFRGMEVSPQQIIIGAGTEYLYGLLIQLLGFHKNYGIEDPGYHKISQIYESHKVSCKYAAMDSSGVQVEELTRQQIDVVHISPSHHFPTGIIMPINRRYELLHWACEDDSRYIIEDDYDSEFRLTGQPIPTLQSIDTREKVIYINTFTKTLASTVRISYMVLPKHLVQKYYDHLRFYSCTVSNFEQYTLARFIQDGFFEKHINRMRNYYHNKRDALLTAIEKSPLSSYVTISEEDAGLHFLMEINTTLSDDEFCLQAKKRGVNISSLSQYYFQPPKSVKHIFIINYSSLDESVIPEAIDALYRIIN